MLYNGDPPPMAIIGFPLMAPRPIINPPPIMPGMFIGVDVVDVPSDVPPSDPIPGPMPACQLSALIGACFVCIA